MKYNCYICGSNFEEHDKLLCPICGNDDVNYLLKSIEIETDDNDEGKEKIKKFLARKCHSSAYIKLCSRKLNDLGYYDLANELERIAIQKLDYEALLLEILGVKDDMRLNLNNVVTRAVEDVNLAKEISDLENMNNHEGIFETLSKMKIEEEKNIMVLSNIAKRYFNSDRA